SLNIFNGYFSWVEKQAQDNIRECVAFLGRADGPALLVGDFNIPAGSPLLGALEAAGYTDLWVRAHPGEDGHTFEADRPAKRIDYAWANEELARQLDDVALLRRERDGARLSDHLGLSVRLDVRLPDYLPPPVSPRARPPRPHNR